MANYVDGVVDQAKAAFTTLELQAHALQDLTQGVISSAKDEFQNMKNIIDGTILKIEASLAAVVVRIDALDEQVKKFRDHGRDQDGLVSAIKALSGRVDQVEGRVGNGGVSPNSGSVPTRGYLPEKSMLPKVFEGNFEEWRNWRDDVSDFLQGTLECSGFWMPSRSNETSRSAIHSSRHGNF